MEIIKITSTQNDLVKYAVKLQDSKFRKKEKMILVDGEQTVVGLVDENIEFEYIFLKEENPVSLRIKAKKVIFVNDEILKKISTTKSPASLVGIIKEKQTDKNIFKKLNKIALIDGVKDAGNLGTIIRSAVAFSIDGIILYGDCVDLYNTKTIRATTQNIFKIPIIKINEPEFIKDLKTTHKLISTVVDSNVDIEDVEFGEKFIVAFGSEADGISDKIADLSDEKVTFKMDNNVESLNLAICASITFAFIRRQSKSK